MMETDMQTTALAVVRKVLGALERYPDDASLMNARVDALDLDSLTKLELVQELEDAFSVLANETEVAACETIGELIALMSRSRVRP